MHLSKKTKIVCTIGPATETKEKLQALVESGMNVMRLNFSHGDFAEHQLRVDNLRKLMKQTGKMVAIMQDLAGPKIRIGDFKNGAITLKEGQTFTLTTRKILGDDSRVSIGYPRFPKEVKVGGIVMIHDGRKKLEITKIKGTEVVTKVLIGGEIKSRRGVNLPGADLSISSITAKDRADLAFGLKNKVDYVALSFVRRASDVRELRALLKKANSTAKIISKIETPQALANIDEILEATDAIMIARGDLAIEIPAEDVPLEQKNLIHKCNSLGKPVITATQMLESMIKSPVPTRAEVSDVANAIIDGTDAIMLSEETTLGEYPVEAVKMMTRIALRVEKDIYTSDTITEFETSYGTNDIISQAAVQTAHKIGAKLIVALTESGYTARMIARYKPAEEVVALTPNAALAPQLALSFGCCPVVTPQFKTLDEAMKIVRALSIKYKLAAKGDKVVIVVGMPFGANRAINTIRIEVI